MDFFGAEENIGLAHMLPNLECLQQSGRAEVVVWRVVAFQENNKKKPKIKKLKQSSTYRKVGNTYSVQKHTMQLIHHGCAAFYTLRRNNSTN